MPDKKTNRCEIVKDCKNCFRYTTCILCSIGGRNISKYCNDFVELDIINRLQAENDNFRMVLDAVEEHIHPLPFETDFDKAINKAKSEAIKEFAEKMKGVLLEIDDTYIERIVEDYIDNLVKEMVGEDNSPIVDN